MTTGLAVAHRDIAAATEAAAAFASDHHHFAGSVAAGLVLAVAPSVGRFHPAPHLTSVLEARMLEARMLEARMLEARMLEAGALVGHVCGGRGRRDEVRSPVRAELHELLVRPGDVVQRGQAVAWLERAA